MKKSKAALLSIFLAVCAASLCFAFAGCGKNKEKEDDGGFESSYGYGEEGWYYYDGSDSSRYMLSLQSGEYMITVGDSTAYSGSYSYDEDSGKITFSGETGFSASMGDSALSLTVEGSGYSFKAYVYFDVTYVDGNGNVIATESVLNGQSATGLEADVTDRDGYWFIGWYEDSSNSAVYAFDTSIAGDTTIYGWYIEKIAGAAEYVVTLDYGDGVTEVWDTTNGAVYRALPENHGGETIVGWWVSATNREGELTYRYTSGEVLDSDTTLFAVYSGLETSVTEDGITWNSAKTGSNVTITVYNENGRRAFSDTASSSSGRYTSSDFTLLSTGTYTVEVSSGSVTDARVYVVNGLPRVSMSSAEIVTEGEGRVLSFAPVEGADGYVITVTNGKRTFTDDLGTDTYYDFSELEMTEEGITFTVTAYADGRVDSVSESLTFRQVLAEVKIEITDDVVYWDAIENALEYVVEITDVDGTVIDSFTTTSTSFSLKYYEAGTYDISVKAQASGYWSVAKTYYGYSKDSLAAPEITDVTNYTVSWTGIAEADSYVVLINGTPYAVESGTTLVFTEYDVPKYTGSYEISVKAVKNGGSDSPYSDAVVATENSFSAAVTYERNTIYWNYDVAATSYVVSVNGEDTVTEEGNSFKITLTQAGDNAIQITAYKGEDVMGYAEMTAFAYAVTLDPNGASLENDEAVNGVIYVAKGDEMHLGTVTKEHAKFGGWYTQPDYTEGQSDEYEGRGGEVTDGSTFTGSGSMYLYAYWTYEYTDVTLYDDTGVFDTVKIKYNSTTFTLPVPTPARAEDDFAGWYLGTDGSGVQMTSGTGEAVGTPYQGYTAMYGFTLETRSYRKTTYGIEDVYSVSATSNMNRMTETTVPATYTVNGVEYNIILSDNAFENCVTLRVINIPDTVRYISVVNDGYTSGTGAFAGCSALQEVNVYVTEKATEPMYFSEDGVLFRKIGETDCVELMYYPYGKTDKSYVMPSEVYNDFEYEATGISHPVTTLPVRVFRYAKMTEITIASSVTTISTEAFYNNPYVETIVFAAGGKEALVIEDGAMQGCTALTGVTLPSRYSEFNASMFDGCYALRDVNITAGGVYSSSDGVLLGSGGSTLVYYPVGREGEIVINNLASGSITEIGENAFAANRNVTSVVISGSVREIKESAFEGCTGIVSVIFEGSDNSGDLTIRTRAFYGCASITEIKLPSNLTVMEADSFGGCSNLVNVYFNARANTKEGDLDFAAGSFGESSAVTTLTLGVYVPLMDFAEIFGGDRLASVIIEETVLSDGTVLKNDNYWSDSEGVVYNAAMTTILYYPLGRTGGYELIESVTDIGVNVFADRVNLTSLTIGKNVNTIADGAFDGCISLTEFVVDPDNINYGSDGGILYAKEYDANGGAYVLAELLCCPYATKTTEITVPETVTSVAAYAFYNNTKIVSVTFTTKKHFELGSYAFYGCTKLAKVVLPEDMTTIPAYAFRNCTALAEINFPDSVTTIEERAFYGCTSLKGDLSGGDALPASLEIVEERAFSGCNNFAATIPAGVTEIGNYAFYTCWDTTSAQAEIIIESADDPEDDVELTLGQDAFAGTHYATGVTVPARVSTMGQSAFVNMGDKVSNSFVVIEEGVTEIGVLAFDAAGISEISIPDSVETIGNRAFYDCDSLKTVTFGDNSKLTSMDYRAFRNCTALTEINLPGGLSTISYGTFDGCTALEEIEIPSGVTTISYQVFNGCTALKSVSIPESVTRIRYQAFYGCTALTSVDLPASLTSLEYEAFSGCTKLEEVTFQGEGGTSKLNDLGYSCFAGCMKLSSVELPANLLRTGESDSSTGAFNGCTALEEITIPATVKVITAGTFSGCTALSAVNFAVDENGDCALAGIEEYAFSGCTALENFEFPESTAEQIELGTGVFSGSGLYSVYLSSNVTDIGSTFIGCNLRLITVSPNNTTYKSYAGGSVIYTDTTIMYISYTIASTSVVLPEGIETIGNSAFSDQPNIKSITFPATLTAIGDYAFSGCTALEEVIFPDGSDMVYGGSIGSHAFDGCAALKSINIPEGVSVLSDYAFYGCDLSGDVNIPTTTLYVGTYAFSGSGIPEIDLPNVMEIGTYAFAECAALEKVALGSSLYGMETYAFYGCTALTEISWECAINEVPEYAFYGCTALEYIEIPSGVATIDQYAFYGCSGLVEVVYPTGLTSIGDRAFRECTSLEKCDLPQGLTTLGQYVFYNCTSLTSLVFPSSLISVGYGSYQGCSSLVTVEFDDALESLAGNMFYKCSSLESVYLTPNITSLGINLFMDCTSLTYAYTGDSVTQIPNYMFDGCSALAKVDFGPDVVSIGEYAFYGCKALTSIDLREGLETMKQYCFRNCTGLEYVVVPSTVTSVTQCFDGCSCPIYLNNTKAYADANLGYGWYGSGTLYYLSETEPGFNTAGTKYDSNYWHYGEDGSIVVWTYSYTNYTTTDGYVLYDSETDSIAYVRMAVDGVTSVYAVTSSEKTATGTYTVVLEGLDGTYTVVLSGTDATVEKS